MNIGLSSYIKIDNNYEKCIKECVKSKPSFKVSYKEISTLISFVRIIKERIPNFDLKVERVNEKTITDYYKKIKVKDINSIFSSKVTLSIEALKKMEKDKEYSLKIISTIIKTALPQSFNKLQLELCDYNIFIKDTGEIEVLTCFDTDYKKMKRKRQKLLNAEHIRRASIKKKIQNIKSMLYCRYRYENNRLKLSWCSYNKNKYIPYEYFLSQSSELKRLMFSLYE